MEGAGLALAVASFCAGWWIDVLTHELLHALGCWATGGEVTRLEIDGIYGAALLHRLFPFVAVGSAYAGQLTGFDTHGSDLVYLATDFTPFLLTVLVGVPLLQAVARAKWSPAWRAVGLGIAAPVAYAPFMSLGADYYEMGSVLVTRAATFVNPVLDAKRWRSDDLVKLATQDLPGEGRADRDRYPVAPGRLSRWPRTQLGNLWSGRSLCAQRPKRIAMPSQPRARYIALRATHSHRYASIRPASAQSQMWLG